MTSKTKVSITLTLDNGAPTPNEVQNAVRRALTTPTLKDVPLNVKTPLVVKGVIVKTRAVKAPEPVVSPIRAWGVENGFPEAAGKRGRLSLELVAAYNEAHK